MAHILAVDDDPDLCTLLKTALERDGHAVEIRTSGVTVTESLCPVSYTHLTLPTIA